MGYVMHTKDTLNKPYMIYERKETQNSYSAFTGTSAHMHAHTLLPLKKKYTALFETKTCWSYIQDIK